jgi:hypothetical protein
MADPRMVAEFRFRSALPLTEQDKSLLAQMGLRRRSDDGSGPRLQLGHQPPIQLRPPPSNVALSNLSPRTDAGGPRMPTYPPPRPTDYGLGSGGPPSHPPQQLPGYRPGIHGDGPPPPRGLPPPMPFGHNVVLPTLPQTPPPQIPSGASLSGGTGPTKPLTPSTVTQPTATGGAPLPKKSSGIVVGPTTNVGDIARHFRDLGTKDDSQSLRMIDRGNGFKELYLHSGTSRVGKGGDRSAKQYAAYDLVKQKLERQLDSSALAGTALAKAGVVDRGRHTELTVANVVKLPSRVQGAIAAEAHRAQQQALVDGRLHLNDPGVTHKVSADGMGGVLFATKSVQNRPDQGVVIKIERDPDSNVAAGFVSDVANHLFSNATVKPPFDMMRMELIPVPQGSRERAELEHALGELGRTATDDRTRTKAQEYRNNLDGLTHVAKYELLQGTNLNRLPANERVALVKNSEFARTVGASAVLMGPLGLNDHVGLSGQGNFNYSNVRLGDDGRLKMIDLSTNPGKGKLGFTDAELTKSINNLVGFLERVAKQGPEVSLRQATRDLRDMDPDRPFDKTLLCTLDPNHDDSLLQGTQGVDNAAKNKFYANLIMGSLEGLQFLRDNIDTLADAHKQQAGTTRIVDPDKTFGGIAKQIDRLDLPKLRAQIEKQVGNHL